MTNLGSRRHDFRAGAKAVAPLLPASLLFGLAFGAAVYASVVDPVVGAGSYFIMVAGASQFVMLDLFNTGAPALVVLGTALLINARFALYSVALGPLYAAFPRRWKGILAFLMTDQAAAISLRHAEEYPDPVRRRWFFFGASIVFISLSWAGAIVGVVTGPIIPASWEISFIVPLMFIALLMPVLRDRPSVAAALVAIAVVVVARNAPSGMNVLAGALAGVVVGWLLSARGTSESTRAAAAHEADAESCLDSRGEGA
jgi:4-azaleucine resistance transporter AzlC